MRRCKYLLARLEPNHTTTLYCRVLHTEVQLRELVRFCARCMYYEEAESDDG